MDDVDPTVLILLAVVALVILKPDLLSGLLGGRPASATPAAPPGSHVTLQQPPTSAWQATGHGDGSGRDAANPAMPVGWKPGDPVWKDTNQATADKRVAAYNAEHPCPSGQMWNGLVSQCLPLGGGWTEMGPPPGQPSQQRSTPAAPSTVSEIKASTRRAALFTPWSGS